MSCTFCQSTCWLHVHRIGKKRKQGEHKKMSRRNSASTYGQILRRSTDGAGDFKSERTDTGSQRDRPSPNGPTTPGQRAFMPAGRSSVSASARPGGRYSSGSNTDLGLISLKSRDAPSGSGQLPGIPPRKAANSTSSKSLGVRSSIALDSQSLAKARAEALSNSANRTSSGPLISARSAGPKLDQRELTSQVSAATAASAAAQEALKQAQSNLAGVENELQAVRDEKAKLQEELDACQRTIQFLQSSNDATSSTSEIYQLMFRQELMGSMSRVEELKQLVEQQAERLEAAEVAKQELADRLNRTVDEAAQAALMSQAAIEAAEEREAELQAVIPRYKNAAIQAELNVDHLKMELEKMQQQTDKLQTELAEANERAATAQSDELFTTHQLEALQREQVQIMEELSKSQADAASLREQLQAAAHVSQERDNLATQLQETQRIIQQLKQEMSQNTAVSAASVHSNEELAQLRLDAAEVSVLRDMVGETNDLRMRCEHFETEAASLRSELQAAKAELQSTKEKADSEVSLLLGRCEALQQQLKDSHAAMLKLQEQVEDIQVAWNEKASAVSNAEARAQQQEAALKTLQQRCERLEETNEALVNQRSQLEAQLQTATGEVEELSAIVTEKMMEIADFTVQHQNLQEQLQQAQAHAAALSNFEPSTPGRAAADVTSPPLPSPFSTPSKRVSSNGGYAADCPTPVAGTPLPADPKAAAALLARRDVQIERLRSNVAALEEKLAEEGAQNRLLKEQVRINGSLREQVAELESVNRQLSHREQGGTRREPNERVTAAEAQREAAAHAALVASLTPQVPTRSKRPLRNAVGRVVKFAVQASLGAGLALFLSHAKPSASSSVMHPRMQRNIQPVRIFEAVEGSNIPIAVI